VIQCYGIKG